MARTELPHGVILPAEYSDDWYEDMTSNLSKLDDVIGSDANKLSEGDVSRVAMTGDYSDIDNTPDLSPYNVHIADANIHVTAADKQKWNDNVNQSYVLRYASTSVTPSSTIAYSVLNNTDNIKIGDSVIDSSGKVFLIVSVDSVNETVTVGSALIDLALDANVVHTSGNETVGGAKTFSEDITIYNSDTSQTTKRLVITSSKVNLGDSNSDSWGISFNADSSYAATINSEKSINSVQGLNFTVRTKDGNNNLISTSYRLRVYTDGSAYLIPSTTDSISFGSSSNKWKDVQTNLVNSLTPSSLSMPSNTYVDISGYVTDLTGGNNQYTAPENGWVYVDSNTTISSVIINNSRGYSTGFIFTGQLGRQRSTLPVCKGDLILINVNCASLNAVRFIPCLGNI